MTSSSALQGALDPLARRSRAHAPCRQSPTCPPACPGCARAAGPGCLQAPRAAPGRSPRPHPYNTVYITNVRLIFLLQYISSTYMFTVLLRSFLRLLHSYEVKLPYTPQSAIKMSIVKPRPCLAPIFGETTYSGPKTGIKQVLSSNIYHDMELQLLRLKTRSRCHATVVLGRHGLVQRVQQQRLLLKAHVALLIGQRAA